MTGLLLGLLLGVRHALEPDHLAAVSTLVVSQRRPGAGALVGFFWGLGHTAALFAVGAALVALDAQMPAGLARIFELGVAGMLVGLGARSMRQAVRTGPQGPRARHRHGPLLHEHAGQADHLHVGGLILARRPLLVGLVHGLAGSGALTALAVARMPTMGARVAFLALFGLGSAAAMALLTGLAGLWLARFTQGVRVGRGLALATGSLSLLLGLGWGWPIARLLLAP